MYTSFPNIHSSSHPGQLKGEANGIIFGGIFPRYILNWVWWWSIHHILMNHDDKCKITNDSPRDDNRVYHDEMSQSVTMAGTILASYYDVQVMVGLGKIK